MNTYLGNLQILNDHPTGRGMAAPAQTPPPALEQLNRLSSVKLSTRVELYKRLRIATEYVEEHLHLNLDLDTIAEAACLSKFHFIRIFKEAYGQTPRQYIIAKRLERARELLLNSEKSFCDICQEVGLKDASTFGRLFKKTFGTTPGKYREMA